MCEIKNVKSDISKAFLTEKELPPHVTRKWKKIDGTEMTTYGEFVMFVTRS